MSDLDYEYDEDYGNGLEVNCQTCCGDCDGFYHTCPNCHGSGLAKDQWFW